MAMSNEQAKIRRWFRRHGWHTGDTPTGKGFWLESPVENCAGLLYHAKDPGTGQKRTFCWERFLCVELDRFNCDHVTISIHKRKHWWKPEQPDDLAPGGYSEVPSDDFEEWSREPAAAINLPARDILKLAELIKEAQTDWMKGRPTRNHLNFMERIARGCTNRWIGVNSSYAEIKRTYSNERLREERAAKAAEAMRNGSGNSNQ